MHASHLCSHAFLRIIYLKYAFKVYICLFHISLLLVELLPYWSLLYPLLHLHLNLPTPGNPTFISHAFYHAPSLKAFMSILSSTCVPSETHKSKNLKLRFASEKENVAFVFWAWATAFRISSGSSPCESHFCLQS